MSRTDSKARNQAKLLYFAPAGYGGLENYAQEQANAIAEHGIDVTLLCPPEFHKRPGDRYNLLPNLIADPSERRPRNKLWRAVRLLTKTVGNHRRLGSVIRKYGFKHVMFASYAEYFAPFWSGGLRRLAKDGVVFGAVVQEPVRDFVVGPLWWHRRSVGDAYSFLREAYVHDPIELDTVKPMPRLRTTVIPYGSHYFPDAVAPREATREKLGIPQDAKVLLAFGHIRDGKRLEYVIDAISKYLNCYLIVAGARQSASQKPESWYQELAASLGVADRCRWLISYASEEEAANLFQASDLAVLTYSSQFRSASGVLNLATRFEKPCIASSGAGALRTAVQKYGIGVWVEPDSSSAVSDGIGRWLASPPVPDWTRYSSENSWPKNAEIVIETLMSQASK